MQWSLPRALVSITLLRNKNWFFFAIRWEGSGSVYQPAGMGAWFWSKAYTSWETLSLLQPSAREAYVDFFSLWTVPINSFTGITLWKTFSFCLGLWGSPSSCCVSQKTISKIEDVWVSMDTSIEPEWQGEFYITWINIFILVKIKSLFQCPYYKESVNIFKLAFFSVLKTIVWEGQQRPSQFFVS